MRRMTTLLAAILASIPAAVMAQEDAEGVYVLTKPERTMEEVDRAYAEIPPIRFEPPADRWANLPRTAAILGSGSGTLKVLMLGDSIINDTSRSRWDDVLAAMYPGVKIVKVTTVRGGTGCWWFKGPGRVQKYVLDQAPDLLILGGISHKDDVDSIRDLVRQVRAGSQCDILLMTGAFGYTDPKDDAQWSFSVDPAGNDYRARLRRLAAEEKAGFFDMTGYWGRYVRESGHDVKWFKRDEVHANDRGQQVVGRLLAGFMAPPAKQD